MKSKSFTIQYNEWEEKSRPEVVSFETLNETSIPIFFLQKGWDSLETFIGWGRSIPENQIEQGGLLYGKCFSDAKGKWVGIYGILEGYSAEGSMKHLHFSHDCWWEMLCLLDRISEDLCVVGWFHTHPLHLNVYMSEVDLKTQSLFFYEHHHCSLILNPQNKHYECFQGAEARKCDIIIVPLIAF